MESMRLILHLMISFTLDKDIPERLARIANEMGIFENVSIGGSDYKVVKRF